MDFYTVIIFSLFPEWYQLFVLSIFFFFPWTSQSIGSYFLLPLELIYFIDCCMVSSWEFLSFFFFLLNGQMFPWSYASPFLFVWLVLLLHSMVHYSRYFLRMVLDRTILPVLECLKKDFILSSLWLITWFDVKSALEIIWSQNINHSVGIAYAVEMV